MNAQLDYLGYTTGEEECAILVMKTKPDALGATRDSDGECIAHYTTKIVPFSGSGHPTCCIFPGNIPSFLLILSLIFPYFFY